MRPPCCALVTPTSTSPIGTPADLRSRINTFQIRNPPPLSPHPSPPSPLSRSGRGGWGVRAERRQTVKYLRTLSYNLARRRGGEEATRRYGAPHRVIVSSLNCQAGLNHALPSDDEAISQCQQDGCHVPEDPRLSAQQSRRNARSEHIQNRAFPHDCCGGFPPADEHLVVERTLRTP